MSDLRFGDRTGASFLFRGPVTGVIGTANADRIYLSGVAGDLVGFSVADGGDVDGDGGGDVIIGALDWPKDGVGSPGNAYVVPVLPDE